MNAWIDAHSALLLCVLGSVLVTQLPKVLPVTFLRGDCLPALLRHWLSFVPVAVMAALVGPDVFFYECQLPLRWPSHSSSSRLSQRLELLWQSPCQVWVLVLPVLVLLPRQLSC